MKTLKCLVWIYLGLLLSEGAIRKWLLPQLSDPLLIVRDPIAVLIYVQAFRLGKFPANPWLIALGALAFGGLVAGLLAETVNPLVMAFGFRTNFLHLPLIFVLPQVFNPADVKMAGRVFLVMALPMALLMALQFQASSTHWLNAGVGGGAQITSALGKIRPAGTFSFISGPIYFFAGVSAFAIAALWEKGRGMLPFAALGIGATILAGSVSGSRSLLGGVALVVAAVFAGLLLYPRAAMAAVRLIIMIALLFSVVSGTQIFREGQTVLESRITIAGKGEGGFRGFVGRFIGGFTEPLEKAAETPVFGRGLGLGTNAGAGLVGARGRFLLAEGEWSRVMLESGPIVGSAFLLFRVFLAAYLGTIAVNCARQGHLLPLLLFGAGGLGLINGQWGQPTTQGFSILLCSMCLAAAQRVAEPRPAITPSPARALRDRMFRKVVPIEVLLPNAREHGAKRDSISPGRFAVRS